VWTGAAAKYLFWLCAYSISLRQGRQRRDIATAGEEQLGRCTAEQSKYYRLYVHIGDKANPHGDVASASSSRSQQDFAALQNSSAGERHAKKANLLQRLRHPIRVPFTPALAHAPPTQQAHGAPTHIAAPFTI
jgi:hypothetical protein